MATNHTENYALNLWEPEDTFSREEFNENTQKLDAAIKAVDGKVGAAEAKMLKYQHFTYVGNNTKTLTLTFEFEPLMVFIVSYTDGQNGPGVLYRGQTAGRPIRTSNNNDAFYVQWEGNSVTLTADTSNYTSTAAVFQIKNYVYGVFALG